MVVSVDFRRSGGASNLVYRGESELTPVVPNSRFQCPEDFVPDFLIVFLNGVALVKADDNGYLIVSTDTFELKETKAANHRVSVAYLTD